MPRYKVFLGTVWTSFASAVCADPLGTQSCLQHGKVKDALTQLGTALAAQKYLGGAALQINNA